ncbi:MAG TPA: thrombospondin type 3 repeat-containing protein [Minicystis sp.]|nr:thrombospondin type 3 repeat-containing protein [Minicystis sp.]
MRARFAVWAGILCLPFGISRSARAADDVRQGVRIDQLQPASPESAFFRSEGPHTPRETGVEFAVRVTADEGTDELREVNVDTSGARHTLATLVSNALLTRVAASISPVHWLSLELGVPFALDESGQTPVGLGGVAPPVVESRGIGDPRVGIHLRPIDTQAFGLVVGGRVWGPFATRDTYLGDGQARAEVDLAIAGERGKLLWGLTANVAPGFFATRDGDRIAASGALYARVIPQLSLGVEPAFELLQDVAPTFSGKSSSHLAVVFEPLGAARLKLGIFRAGLAAGPGFGAMGAAGVRVLADVGVVVEGKPPPPVPVGPSDRDMDGIPDNQDACPDDAGPRSADPQKNGCPTHDRDADGVRDEDDYCPDRPGIKYPDPKGNGCPDSDNDGIPDPVDACPNEPGKAPQGCPSHARLTKDTFTVTPPLQFAAGSDRLTVDARASIEEIAATVHANPKTIDQVSIGIGTKGAPAALADRRAQAILLVLRAAALESDKYEVVLRDDVAAGKVAVRVIRP